MTISHNVHSQMIYLDSVATQAGNASERTGSDVYDASILSQWVIQSWTGVGSLTAELLQGALYGSLLERYLCRLTLAYYADGDVEKAWDEFVSVMHATKNVESSEMCSICYENIGDGVQLQCEHVFHDECISRWFLKHTTCPMCRYDVLTSYIPET